MTAITAVTSQNTTGVLSIIPISSAEVSKQIEFTSKDIKPDVIKIGMLHSSTTIYSVIKSLSKIKISSGSMPLVTSSQVQLLGRSDAKLAYVCVLGAPFGPSSIVTHN